MLDGLNVRKLSTDLIFGECKLSKQTFQRCQIIKQTITQLNKDLVPFVKIIT